MFGLLDRLHHTADGLDGFPAWFLRRAAPVFDYPLAYLVNLSINSVIIPEQWKTAIIRPVAKVPHPVEPSDYGPISVVPVLSRIVERLVVHSFIHYGDLYSAHSRLLLRSAPDPCTAKKKSFETRVECVRKNPGEESLRQRKPKLTSIRHLRMTQ